MFYVLASLFSLVFFAGIDFLTAGIEIWEVYVGIDQNFPKKWKVLYNSLLVQNGTARPQTQPICCCVTPTHLQSGRGIKEMLWHRPTCRVWNRAERRQWPLWTNQWKGWQWILNIAKFGKSIVDVFFSL